MKGVFYFLAFCGIYQFPKMVRNEWSRVLKMLIFVRAYLDPLKLPLLKGEIIVPAYAL